MHESRYAFLGGELELVLYDERDDVSTTGLEARLFLSGRRRQLLVIPRGVWHAERNVGSEDVVVVNFPTIPYDHASPDKFRLLLDTTELPVYSARGGTAGGGAGASAPMRPLPSATANARSSALD